MAEQWLELADSGLVYDWSPMEVAGSLSLIGSTISATNAEQGGTFDPLFELFVADALSIRLTFQSYETDSINNGVSYSPAEIRNFDSDPLQVNEAAPYPSGTWSLPTGPQTEWSPNPVELTGQTEVAYLQTRVTGDGIPVPETFSILVEVLVDVPDPPVPPPDTCQEIGRATRAYVSAYTRERIHQSRLFPQEKRCLIANFNGALPAGRTIVQAQWDIDAPYCITISDAFIASSGNFIGRETGVTMQACWDGDQVLRCQVTLDNGEIYTQLFYVACMWRGWFGDTMPAAGPSRLVVTAS